MSILRVFEGGGGGARGSQNRLYIWLSNFWIIPPVRYIEKRVRKKMVQRGRKIIAFKTKGKKECKKRSLKIINQTPHFFSWRRGPLGNFEIDYDNRSFKIMKDNSFDWGLQFIHLSEKCKLSMEKNLFNRWRNKGPRGEAPIPNSDMLSRAWN